MKVFISADIEGVTTSTALEECNADHPSYPRHAEQMTKEVLAACEGALRAGATEIWVKDAHGAATNIDPTAIPSGVRLLRGWSGHPYSMVEGVDGSFDAAMFIGYHSAAGMGGNPLSHTISGKPAILHINGRVVSEFFLYSYACALEGVPSVFLSGDEALCNAERDLHPKLLTLPVKSGDGGLSVNRSPQETLKAIGETAERALRQDFSGAAVQLPEYFEAELRFRRQTDAKKASYFPGARLVDDTAIAFESDSFLEILRTIYWVLH